MLMPMPMLMNFNRTEPGKLSMIRDCNHLWDSDPRDDLPRGSSGERSMGQPRTKCEERWRWAMGAFRRDRRTDGRAMAMNGRAMAMGRGEFQWGREVRLEFAGFRASSGIG